MSTRNFDVIMIGPRDDPRTQGFEPVTLIVKDAERTLPVGNFVTLTSVTVEAGEACLVHIDAPVSQSISCVGSESICSAGAPPARRSRTAALRILDVTPTKSKSL
jgi:hypothetical protein